MARILFSAATCSWIDPATGLPEVDDSTITQPSKLRSFLVGNSGYRFCNFMETWIDLSPDGRSITASGFTPESRMYRGPSFAHIPSHAFSVSRQTFAEADAVRFTQIVGARTVSPEVIGTTVGGILGAIVLGVPGAITGAILGDTIAHQITGFPPIWTKIQIRIFRDGRAQGQILQHSLFPSMTIFVQQERASATPGASYDRASHPNGQTYYNATKEVELPDWKARGWGPLANSSVPGPCAGNPWGTTKGVTGGSENLPG